MLSMLRSSEGWGVPPLTWEVGWGGWLQNKPAAAGPRSDPSDVVSLALCLRWRCVSRHVSVLNHFAVSPPVRVVRTSFSDTHLGRIGCAVMHLVHPSSVRAGCCRRLFGSMCV